MERGALGRAARGLAWAALVALAGPVAWAGTPKQTGGEAFDFEVTLAPVCLDGTFPIRLSTAEGPLDGALDVATDARGKLSGRLVLGEVELAVTGKVRYTPSGHSVKITASAGKKDRLTLVGAFRSGDFAGTARAKGSVAPGATGFTLDLSSSAPTVAHIRAVVSSAKKGRLGGGGTVTACGLPLTVKARGKDGKSYSLTLKGQGFRLSGRGDHVPGDVVLTWSARGFGATTSEQVIPVDTLLAPRGLDYPTAVAVYETEEPIAPNVPVVTGDPATAWTIEPALPPGLEFDDTTGAITGEPTGESPQEEHTVTAANPAGSVSAVLRIGTRRNRRYSLEPQRDLTDDDLRHFLTRTHWHADPADMARIRNHGLGAFVDDMLKLRLGSDVERTATAEELRDDGDPDGIVPNTTEVARWWQSIMLHTDAPFQEALAFFWSDHFAVGNQDIARGAYMVDYVNLFRRDGAGNLRDLLVAMARHPAMLKYLNGDQNRRGAPNENFARELWELFTLGVDNGYTQDDIVEASRALTGWRERSRQVVDYPEPGRSVTDYYVEFDPSRHDTGAKTFLGVTIPGQDQGDDYEAVVDTTLAQRAPELFVCRKLLGHFVMKDPPEELVEALGAVLRDADWELKPVLSAMFRSEAFFSRSARGAFVKSPVEYGVGFLRATGLQIRTRDLDTYMNTLGMRPTQPPVVDGWPTGSAWLSAQGMVDRTNLIEFTVDDVTRQTEWGLDVLDLLPPPDRRSAAEIVDELTTRLAVTLGPDERQRLVDYMVTVRQGDGTVVPSPLTETNLDQRVRGALYVLAQHPTYHVR